MNLYNQIKYNGYRINIYYDDDARSPREAYDNLGTLYTAHRRYRPEKEFDDHFDIDKVFEGHIGNFRESFLKEYIALPVYLDKVRREYGWKNITAKRRKRIEGYLQDEISTLDNYYTGEVFGYRIMPESDDDNELDSCWGFYGTECMKELEAECRHIIDGQNKAVA